MKIPTQEEKRLIRMIQKGLAYSLGEARGKGYSIIRSINGETSEGEIIGCIRNVFVPFRNVKKKKLTAQDIDNAYNRNSKNDEYFPKPEELCTVYLFSPYGHQTWFNGKVTEINIEQRRVSLGEGFSVSNGRLKEEYFSSQRDLTFFNGNLWKIVNETEFSKGLERARVFARIGEYEI